ncbi:MAG: AMP-binding protein, partial [SAR324 cluster bacterium]|nr:AMP-binding protein [SAR324 cluster bacterium]
TTGNPKGVVYHHRGAYLNALSNIVGWNMAHHPVYLWTLPMFHCNGWCFPWTLAAIAGTSVCLRNVSAGKVYAAIADYDVSHFCGAPVVLNLLINAPDSERRDFAHTVNVMTAAAPPPPSVLTAMEAQGFAMTHVYGLTETYGPAVICAWKSEWNDLPGDEQARVKARQGVPYHALEDLQILEPGSLENVQPDAQQIGE